MGGRGAGRVGAEAGRREHLFRDENGRSDTEEQLLKWCRVFNEFIYSRGVCACV